LKSFFTSRTKTFCATSWMSSSLALKIFAWITLRTAAWTTPAYFSTKALHVWLFPQMQESTSTKVLHEPRIVTPVELHSV
jgi:hypothetical protein